MHAEGIIEIASKLSCGPPDAAVDFARMVAEHCAQLVEEFDPEPSGLRAAAHIRMEFRIA